MESTLHQSLRILQRKTLRILLVAVLCFSLSTTAQSMERQKLHGNVPVAASRLSPHGHLDPAKRLALAIGLPLRNQAELTQFLKDLSDPASPSFRQYLTPAQFTERFGPTEKDYQAVANFAKANGLTVTTRHPNRVILDVEGAVSDIEKALHVTLRTYRHPFETRDFYAPDVEPSVDLPVSLSHISGLDSYSIPHPNLHMKPAGLSAYATPNAGSGPNGAYAGGDFRAAYVPNTTLTGSGQAVGLLQFDGYYASDIAAYKTQFGLPDVLLVNVPVDGGVSTPGSGNSEVCLDIEMVISMAPGVSKIYVYEAPNPSPWVDLLNKMANDNLAKQLSCSWGGGSQNAAAEAIFQQMAAQGQSFFNATGDSDAFTGSISFPSDSPNITEVGATTLTTSGAGGSYVSETVWNWGSGVGSSGGTSLYYAIPSWQQGVSMSGNQGSTTMRNMPDVSLTGDNVYVMYNNGSSGAFGGTSCAAPLWAAFTALVNQQATTYGRPTVGFLNPAIYTLAMSGSFTSVFRDTTTGNNFSSSSPTKFSAVTGYDLCTGWGTPAGTALINALSGPPAPVITTANPLPPGMEGTAYTQTLAANGGATPYAWSISSGSLPSGLSLSSSGVIIGVPGATGTASFTVQVTGADGLFTTTAFSLTIYLQGTPIIATSSPLSTGTVGTAFNQTLAATGGALPYMWSISSGSLPAGLNLSSGGVISGTPTTTGTTSFSIQVAGADGLLSTAPFTLAVNPAPTPPTITSSNPLPTGVAGAAYNRTLTASGGTTPYLWAVASGTLPSGLSLSSAGVIAGTPSTSGTASFTVQVTGSNGLSSTKGFSLTINPQGTLTNGSFETGDFSNWITSDIPVPFQGLKVRPNGYSPGYGLFSCVATDGTYCATHGFDGNGPGVIRIAQEISVSASAPFLTFDYRAGWDMQTYTGSTKARTFAVTVQPSGGGSTLLNAVQLTAAPATKNLDTGLLNGIVDLSAFAGTTIRVCFDANIPEAHTGPGFFELDNVRLLATVPLVITTSSPLPSGSTGTAYSQTLAAVGGTAPYNWSLSSGSLPQGVTLSSAGVISGTPVTTGTSSFTVKATDSKQASATKTFSLTITPPLALSFPLDTDPGWTRQGQWAFGKPTGGGGTYWGSHDPTAGATGTNVFGVNLAGDYSTTVGGPYYLTAGPLNFSNYTGVKLQFQRWLNTCYQPYVAATIQVSNDGTNWTQVFANPTGTPIWDAAWTTVQYDISSVADKHSAVYVRWGYAILTSGPPPCSGWNIDDIQFLGTNLGVVTLNIPASASEGAGVVAGTVTLSSTSTTSITVSLASSDTKTVTVPATVTIPAGQTSAGFNLTVLNDSILNGTRSVAITASATGYSPQSKTITITDNETAHLSVILPASVREGDPAVTGTVSMDAPAGADIAVTVSASDPTRLALGNATIPTGKTSGTFSLAAVDDNKINGTKTVTVTAHVANWTDGTATVNVLDNEGTNLTLSVPATAREGDGTKTGAVQIAGTLTTDLIVSLASDNTGKIIVPATATIPAGQTSGSFALTIVDNTVADGAQTATITASASGFTSTSASIVVADNEVDHFVFAAIASPQIRNAPFGVSITAYDINNSVITNYSGTLALSGSGSTGTVPVTPASATGFVNGVWTRNVSVGAFDDSVTLSADDGAKHTASSNAFAVGTGPLHHFGFGTVSSPQTAGTAFPLTVTAQDAGNNTVTDYSGQTSLTALSGSGSASSATIVISEIDTSDLDQIEFTNVTQSPIDFSGWKFIAYDWNTWPAPGETFTFPAGSVCPAGGIFRLLESGGTSPGTFPSYYIGTNIYWNNDATGNPVGALLLDSSNKIIDFVCAFDADPTKITSPVTIPIGQWSGSPVPANTTSTLTFQRKGNSDNNNNSDWVIGAGTPGTLNSGLTIPFASGTVSIPVTPSSTGTFAAGVWSGDVSVLQPGVAVTLSGSDSLGYSGTSNTFDVTTEANLAVSPANGISASGIVGGPFTPASTAYTVSNSGTGSMNWTVSGTSSWLSFSPAGGTLASGSSITVTATINGTANTLSSGSYGDTIAFANTTNGFGSTTRAAALTVASAPPVITSALSATGTNGNTFSYQIAATNSPTSYNATGLPTGLSVNTASGIISGTPTVTGTSNVTISASNAWGTASATLVLTVLPPPPVITSALTATGTSGSAFTYQITATNSPTGYNATGLPEGLSVNMASGLISGTPATTGTTSVTISASNATGSGSATLMLTVLPPPPPVITSVLSASATEGMAFAYQIAATNSPTGYNATGLPEGLSVNMASGLISGTPAVTGTSSITLSASNATGSGSATLVLTIQPPPPPVITSSGTASGTFGALFSYQITAANSPTSYSATGLPSGLSINTATGLISGTLTQTGAFTTTINATNAWGTGSATLTISVPTVVAWGWNFYGQTTVPAGLNNVVSVAGGDFHSLALKSDGTVVAWGEASETAIPTGLNNVIAIAAGYFHSLALKSDGTVVVWGDETTVPTGLNNVVAISGGFYHSLALKSDGTVVAWGDETTVPTGLNNVVAISAGGYHNLALRADGTVVAWGDNSYGQTNVPAGLGNVLAVSAGIFHSLALKSDGTVVAWGENNEGQTNVPPGLSGVVAIFSGPYHSLALKSDGTVVAWGENIYGQATIPTGLNSVVAISAGGYDSFALMGSDSSTSPPAIISPVRALGALYPFQYQIVAKNSPTGYGATGLPSGLSVNTSTGLISGIPTQSGTFNAILSATNAWGNGSATLVLTVLPSPPLITSASTATGNSGSAFSYQITATNTPTSYGASGLPSGLNVNTATGLISGTPTQSGTFNATISASNTGGTGSAPLVLTVLLPPPPVITSLTAASGTFGSAFSYQIAATNSPTSFGATGLPAGLSVNTSTGLVSGIPAQTGAFTSTLTATNAGGGGSATLTIRVQTVVAWGDNFYGQTTVPSDLDNVVAISAGGNHTLALKEEGTVVAWGDNAYGKATVPIGLDNVVAISGGGCHSLALKTDGTVVAWGYNVYGQTTVPTGLDNVVAISAGWMHSLALKSDGTIVAWGDNSSGQSAVPAGLCNVVAIAAGSAHSLALKSDGTVVDWGDSGEITVPSGLNNVVAIAAGGYHSLALKSDGTVVSWGRNSNGQATVPTGLNNVVAIAAGMYHSLALKSGGTVVAWGYNASGQATVPSGLGNVVAITGGEWNSLALTGNDTPTSPPVIISPWKALGSPLYPLQYRIVAKNSPTNYSVNGLPVGLSLDTSTGLITGTPTLTGTFSATVSANNAWGTGSATLAFVVPTPFPAISSALTATGTSSYAFTYQIAATNLPTSYGATGLPSGLSADTPTGLITGTPTQSGTFNATLSATNIYGTGSATLVLTVQPPLPVITSALTATGTNGSTFNYQITATNSPTNYGATNLPSGLSVDTSTGLITGTPTQSGTFNTTVSAINIFGTSSATLVLTVLTPPPPAITGALSKTGTNGSAFSYQITATNSPTSYGATGLPAGLNVQTATGLITGTPTQSGTFNATLSATNGWGTGSATLVLTVLTPPPPTITSALTKTGTNGLALSYQITAANSPASFNATGLPSGLITNTVTGVISGTPTQTGTFNSTISATNAGGTGTAILVLTVQAPVPVITSSPTATGTSGVSFSYQITATNSPTSYGATGLPSGLNQGGGTISGIPTVTGTFNVTIRATNVGGVGTATLVLTILAPPIPVITSAATASGTYGAPLSYQITATNSPNSFGVAGLPSGLSINTSTGLISGTPTQTGTFNAVVSAGNEWGTGSATVVLKVSAPPPPSITGPWTATGACGQGLSCQITATNNPQSYAATGLPPGLSVNTLTGLISGTPTQSGTFNVILNATNSWGTGTGWLTIYVYPQVTPVITSAVTATGANSYVFSYQITATNSPTSYDAIDLPPGLNVNTATGLISGTPTQSGTFNVILNATNGWGTSDATLTLTVLTPMPVITSVLEKTGTDGAAFSYQIMATYSPTGYDATGLPSGLSIDISTGLISGTPIQSGTFNVILSATNEWGTGNATLVLTALPPVPVITSSPTATGTSGVSFNYQITAINSPTTYGASGLPSGLNQGGGTISGISTVTGTFNVTIKATNASGSGTATLVLTVLPHPPVITSSGTASGTLGLSFNYQITTGTNAATSYGAAGLPPGLDVNPSTGLVSGIPAQTGTFNSTISATNVGGTGYATLVLAILPSPPFITSSATATATCGSPFSYQITATNSPTSYGATGLPSRITANTSTGLISGTATQTGTFNATISATNAFGTGSATLTIAVRTPFEAWKYRNFSGPELLDATVSGDGACPLHDGIPNLMKYAMHRDLREDCSGALPVASLTPINSNNYLTLTYTQHIFATDIIYTVEVSGDMATWTSGTGYTATVTVTDNADGVTQSVIVQDLMPLNSVDKRFIRLKVTRP